MFGYLPKDPDSARSVLRAGFRLYGASFKYSLGLTVCLSLTLTICFLALDTYTLLNDFLVSFIGSLVSLIFLIPLIKRIYSVGAGLPISTQHAFDGFFSHFIRITIVFCLLTFLSLFIVVLMGFAAFNTAFLVLSAFVVVILYFYILLKIYFANMFIILENQHIWDALKNSARIESHHMWLTFWVIFTFTISFMVIITFASPHLGPNIFVQNTFTAIASIIAIPLFVSIQVCQFFNLKRLRDQSS